MASASKYEILFDLPKGEYNAAEVGGIRTKTFRMGEVIEVECYPLTRIGSAAKKEAQRRHKQRACQAALNRRNAEKRIRRLIDMNFTSKDFVITPTWDYGSIDRFQMSYAEALRRWDALKLPIDEDDARRELNNYWRRIKTRIRQTGNDPKAFKYIYVVEQTRIPMDSDPTPLYPHYHFHCVVHAPGLTMDDLEELWPHGRQKVTHLSLKWEGSASIANYITKNHGVEEVDRNGKRVRRWGGSRNLKEPIVTVSDRRISRRRAKMVAEDVAHNAAEVFGKITAYEDYNIVGTPEVRYSNYISGAYIYARLRYNAEKAKTNRKRREAREKALSK